MLGISENEVLAVLADPAVVRAERKGRRNAWRLVGERGIKVVFVEDTAGPFIITVIRQQRRPRPCNP
jgi:hypothetical protein